jgi:hypothetical protein
LFSPAHAARAARWALRYGRAIMARMKLRQRRNAKAMGYAASAVLLAACGGGDPVTPAAEKSATHDELRGVVIDAPGAAHAVFLDLNQDGAPNANEPQGRVAGDGSFVLRSPTLTPAHLAVGAVVVEGADGWRLQAPASTLLAPRPPGVVSRLTSAVSEAILAHGLTVAEATDRVRRTHALGDENPLADYVGNDHPRLREAARLMQLSALSKSAA